MAFRAEPRFTKDVDLAVAVANDQEAEGIVHRLQVRGYALASLVEQDYVNRLATARLVRPQVGTSSAFIDLFFANSGIEEEIVRRADLLEVLPGVSMPVASMSRLIHPVGRDLLTDMFLRRRRLRPSHSFCRFRRPVLYQIGLVTKCVS